MSMPSVSRVLLACGCLLLILCEGARADVSVSIRGVVMAPVPCVVNGGSTLDISFGNEVVTNRVDGLNHRVTVPYTVTCGPQPTNSMTLTLRGVGPGLTVQFCAPARMISGSSFW